MKIFKYEVKDNKAYMPNGTIIRRDFVDDGYYHGDFVWSIVDPEDSKYSYVDLSNFSNYKAKALDVCQIGVREKQYISTIGKPIGCLDVNGMLYLKLDGKDMYESTIRLYKTGQQIEEPIEELTYLGFMKIWIKQELGLYCFATNIKVYPLVCK